jgi:AmiR/NasT family two-component response regulator
MNTNENIRENFTFLVHNNDIRIGHHLMQLIESNYNNSNVVLVDSILNSLNLINVHKPDVFIVEMTKNSTTEQLIQLINAMKYKIIVVVAADNHVEIISTCLSLGVKGYVITPIVESDFLKTINDVLARHD